MNLILPKASVDVDQFPLNSRPLFFLAGPVRGGGDWQKDMCSAISDVAPDAIIASPTRWNKDHELYDQVLPETDGFHIFRRQLDWERHYLEVAGSPSSERAGCVLFWLGLESISEPHPGPEPYAMDTRRELGEWMYRKKMQFARVVIGADPAFHGLSVIERTHEASGARIQNSMRSTAEEAVRMAFSHQLI